MEIDRGEFPALDYGAWNFSAEDDPAACTTRGRANARGPLDLPGRLHLGNSDGGVPDRGRGDDDGRGPSIWDDYCRVAGQRTGRRHRRRGLRPLPPGGGGPRPDGVARPAGVPVLGGLAARRCPRVGRGQPARPGLLRPARRRAAGPRDRPARDALPLGPARGDPATHGGWAARARRSCSPSTPRWSAEALGDRVPVFGPRSTSRGARRSSATPAVGMRPGMTRPAAA